MWGGGLGQALGIAETITHRHVQTAGDSSAADGVSVILNQPLILL